MKNYKVLFQEIPWESPAPGVRFKAYGQNGKRLRLVEFSQEFVEPDWCEKGHVGYVLSGKMTINFDGEMIQFQTGDGIFIPPGKAHKHMVTVADGTVQLVLIEDA